MMTLQDAAGPAGLAVNMLSRIAGQGMADPGLAAGNHIGAIYTQVTRTSRTC